jgi:uncharacterized protein YneF (UPF0154 family)
MSIATVLLVVAVVLMVIGFACGWYVRGAYVRRYMKRRMKVQRKAFADKHLAMVEQSVHEATKHNVFSIPEECARDPELFVLSGFCDPKYIDGLRGRNGAKVP